MPKLVVLYPPPTDVQIFEGRYRSEHVPLVMERIEGLRKFVAAKVIGSPMGAPQFHRIAELYFDSREALQAALSSSGGQAAAGHAAEISTGGAPGLLIAEDDRPA